MGERIAVENIIQDFMVERSIPSDFDEFSVFERGELGRGA